MATQAQTAGWTYGPKLSGSENHRGYIIRDRSGAVVADVIPYDSDGIVGGERAALIVRAVNAHEAMREALSGLVKTLDMPELMGHCEMGCEGCQHIEDEVERLVVAARSALALADGREPKP